MLHTTNYDLTVEASELLGISSHTKYHQALWGEEPRVMTVEVTVTETGNIAFLNTGTCTTSEPYVRYGSQR